MLARDRDERGVLLAVRRAMARGGDHELLGRIGEAALGLEVQQISDVVFSQCWQGCREGERPTERHANRAAALANFRGVEVVADFLAHEFRLVVERVEREQHGEILLHFRAAIDAAHDRAGEARAVEREAEHDMGRIFFAGGNHRESCASRRVWRTSEPSAQPRWVRS